MATLIKKSKELSFTVNILIKKIENLCVAHCLELDIVATGKTPAEAEKEIVSLICAQVDYAFSNNNLDHLYHLAPPEIWKEFFACKEQMERKYKLQSDFRDARRKGNILPPWLIAKTCELEPTCHV